MSRSAILAGLIALIAATQAYADPVPALVTEALGRAAETPVPLSYDVMVKDSGGTVRYTRDVTATAAARVTGIEPAESSLNRQQHSLIDRARTDTHAVWCANRYLTGATDFKLEHENDAEVVFSFAPSAEAGGTQSMAMAPPMGGEVTISKADQDVTAVRLFATKPFSVSVLRIKNYAVSVRCEPAANGRRFAAETVTDMNGSVMLFHVADTSTEQVSNLRLPE